MSARRYGLPGREGAEMATTQRSGGERTVPRGTYYLARLDGGWAPEEKPAHGLYIDGQPYLVVTSARADWTDRRIEGSYRSRLEAVRAVRGGAK